MNKQGVNGIEWTDYTWNPTSGCLHGCTWKMPDGSVTQCYAKSVAEGVARAFYPNGFESHEWHPNKLSEPLKVKKPGKVFLGSMADMFGHWVPEDQIRQVMDVMKRAHWHIFQTLSKNPLRQPDFNPFPDNVWVGVSLPAGHLMNPGGAARALKAYLGHMERIEAKTRFMSIEPLWFDAAEVYEEYLQTHDALPFEWAIIGAASKGKQIFQPDSRWVEKLLVMFDKQRIPVFFKGNLKGNPAARVWRQAFPGEWVQPIVVEEAPMLRQLSLFEVVA